MMKINSRKLKRILKRILKRKKFTIITLSIVIIALLFVFVTFKSENNFIEIAYTKVLNSAGIYTKEVKSIDIDSGNYDDAGSWKITKSAKWTSTSTAQIEFNLDTVMKVVDTNYKDVILVIDVSGSMSGEKLDKVKSDSKELVEYLLSNSKNRVALITFESSSTILSELTNDKDTILYLIDNLSTSGCTNYNEAYKNINTVMEAYSKESNRDVTALFLTDGYPNEETPNQVGTYEILKDQYSYMTINGVQYEMGLSIITEIVEITDNQWVASQETLNNVLFDATVSPIKYESFTVTDYIDSDYFSVANESDITVSQGTIVFDKDNQKITWNLGENTFATGSTATMTIKVNLNSSVSDDDIYLPTNTKESVTYKLPDEKESTVNSSNTPVLKSEYDVIYDANAPAGCTVLNNSTESHKIYTTVTKKSTELSCSGYLFKGWEIDDDDSEDVTIVNEDNFIMPAHDVTIGGTWTKQSITKSVSGTVHEKNTLYKVLEQEAKTGTYAKTYTGSHQDSISNNGTSNIYYYYAANSTNATTVLDKNNVIFAGQCWQMIRTTDTGGVKLIYNGEAENNQCLSTRGAHVGYGSRTSQTLSSSYYYGTSYTYDSSSKTFTLDGDLIQATWSASTYNNLIGKYTCKSASSTGTCSTLYYVEKYYSATSAYTLTLNSSSYYYQFGTLPYNSSYNSPTYVGYKYGDVYAYSTATLTPTKTILSSLSLSTNYYYSDEVEYDSSTGKYTLTNPEKVTSSSSYSSLVGYYTFRNSSSTTTSTSVYYIEAVSGSTMHYVSLTSGKTIDDYTITFGNTYTDNGDGTYTLGDTTTVKYADWYSNYSSYTYKYTCGYSSTTCSNLQKVVSYVYKGYTYPNNTYRYGSSVAWNGSTYTLVDPIEYDSSSLSTHHYTCLGDGTSCTSVKYIYYSYDSNGTTTGYYITLSDGTKDVDEALSNMFTKNTTDSDIKSGIDAWYEKYLLDYSDYLEEDTIFCNDRSIRSLGGWNPNGGSLSSYLYFKESSVSSDLSCTNETDKFSVSNPVATLKYPVGLMTRPEMNLLGGYDIRNTGSYYWLLSPYSFYGTSAVVYRVDTIGSINDSSYVYNTIGVRPSVSLTTGIEYSSGDGSMSNPYIVDTSGV